MMIELDGYLISLHRESDESTRGDGVDSRWWLDGGTCQNLKTKESEEDD
jgi:hypothetical protein